MHLHGAPDDIITIEAAQQLPPPAASTIPKELLQDLHRLLRGVGRLQLLRAVCVQEAIKVAAVVEGLDESRPSDGVLCAVESL
jgi:hypothetical protein